MLGQASRLANPAAFLKVSRPAMWIAGLCALGLIAAGSVLAFFFSPPDFRQGESVRIMYVHVPAAWLALQTWALIAVASFVGFVWRHRVADLAARAAAPIGLAFTILALVTGALWGKVTWGVYWDWDPRLTFMLVQAFLYAGYMAIWAAIENEATAARIAALFAILGAVNLPIVKFSVDWWDSLHQKAAVVRPDGPTLPASMLWPLLVMGAGYVALSLFYTLLRTRTAVRRRSATSDAKRAPSTATLEPAE